MESTTQMEEGSEHIDLTGKQAHELVLQEQEDAIHQQNVSANNEDEKCMVAMAILVGRLDYGRT